MSTVSPACASLLERGRAFAPQYGNRLTNHLPMALVALDRLGADAGQLERFYEHYSMRLLPLGDPAASHSRARGKHTNFVAVAGYFGRLVERNGRDAVLRECLPVLLPGVAAAAFHALIRLAYALDAGDDGEIAYALAYWATEYAQLALPAGRADEDLEAITTRLAEAVKDHVFIRHGVIVDRMRQIAAHPALAGAATQPAQLGMDSVAQFAISRFARHDDFTLLHAVTACHAMRLVLPHAADQELALRHLWQAILMASLTVPRHAGPEAAPRAATVDEIKAACRDSTNDHQIKLCYSALCEYEHYGDLRYLQVAARATAPRAHG